MTKKSRRLAARLESDCAFVAHHENLQMRNMNRSHSVNDSHERLSDVHSHHGDVGGKVSNTDRPSESDDYVANSAETLTEGDEPASDRPFVRKVCTCDRDPVRQNVWRC